MSVPFIAGTAATALQTSGTTQCTANVQGTGAFNTAVEWSVEGGGEIGADGSFTAPVQAATVTVTASSVSHPNVSGAMPLTSIGDTIELALAASLVDGSNNAIANASVQWASSDREFRSDKVGAGRGRN